MSEDKTKNTNKEQNNFFPQFSDILSISSNPEDLFTLLYPIGHGGFGTVYKAIHNSTNNIVAIKIIDFIKKINNNSQLDNNNNIFLNYYSVQQETSLMKLGNKSKYIVHYYGSYFSRKTNTLWLILEYCSSGSAIDLMVAMNRTFTEIEISTIMENVLQGLIIIHSMNLIHRDIKGANILLSEDGYAKLGDFGVGIQLPGGGGYRNSKKGSPYWMSPQVVKNINYDMKTDIWSLGITCSELCNGEPPFSNLNPKNVMEKIAMFPPTVDDVINKEEHTDEFYDFVKNCLEIDPKKRPNAQELIKHKFITKYSKGNKFLSELITSHSEDIDRFRKIINETKKNKLHNKNKDDNKDIKINENNKEKIEKLNLNKIFLEKLKDKSEEENKITLGQKNTLNNEENMDNESNFTSHFHNEGKLNKIQEKEQLLINNKIILSSSNLENFAINSTKDSQKIFKNSTNIKNDFDKIIYIDYHLNNIISDSSSENNRQQFTTFHFDNDDNCINSNNSNQEGDPGIIHHQSGSFNKNHHLFKSDKIETNINNKNNNILYKPLLSQENINNAYHKKNSKKNILYRNKNDKKSRYNCKSTDNIFLNNSKLQNESCDKNKNIKNFVYKKKKIKKNSKNIKTFNKISNNNKFVHKNHKFNKGYTSNRSKEYENIILDISDDEEGSINKTNLFSTKSNFAIFKNDKDKYLYAETNYYFYKNKNQLEEKNINKNERNNTKNNYSDLSEYDVGKIKYHINNSKILNKIHQKYFGK